MDEHPDPPRTDSPRGAPRSRTLTVALVVSTIGIVATLLAFVDLALGSDDPPLVYYLLALLLPVGLVIAAVAVARDYRRPR